MLPKIIINIGDAIKNRIVKHTIDNIFIFISPTHFDIQDFLQLLFHLKYISCNCSNIPGIAGIIIKPAATKPIYDNTRLICIKTRAQTLRKKFSLRSSENKNKIPPIIKETSAAIHDQPITLAKSSIHITIISSFIVIILSPQHFACPNFY